MERERREVTTMIAYLGMYKEDRQDLRLNINPGLECCWADSCWENKGQVTENISLRNRYSHLLILFDPTNYAQSLGGEMWLTQRRDERMATS